MKISRKFKSFNLTNCSTSIQRAVKTLFNNPYDLSIQDYGHLLQFSANRRFLRLGQQIHARFIVRKFAVDNFIGSKFITFYSRNDRLWNARKVFDEIPQRNTWSYNAMLIAYSSHSEEIETLTLFSSFLRDSDVFMKPDNFSLTCVLKALSSLFFDVDLGKEIHCYGLRNGFDSDLFVVNGLITYYSRCDELGLARKVFDLMRKRDIVSWNSMIGGYSHGGCYDECLKLFKLMLELDDGKVRPDGVTIANVLQSCAQKKDLVRGVEVHQYVMENNIEGDSLVCNSILGLYAKCGKLDYARELFEQMIKKDEVTYGCLISGYLAYGHVDNAMNLFREMENPSLSTWNGLISGIAQNNLHELTFDLIKEMQASGFRPNSVTIATLLSSLSNFPDLGGGKQVHAYAIRNNYDSNIYVTTGLIDVYGKSSFLLGARLVFDQSRHRSVVIWTAIIAGYLSHEDPNQAIKLFEDMLEYGTQPDPVTLTVVLTACAELGDTRHAQKILEKMHDKYGIQPVTEHYACVVRVLVRDGKFTEAEEFISKLRSETIPNELENENADDGDLEIRI
ncbi:pentatricopeptide repeat-containing protein At2g37310 [Silene latifolia]|uniref:pentatricopeptide repeat-containing protein At2g37310 n=1 Tax=Silene latifolia TaxID=37657 RepID=UPI003D782020